MHQPAGLKVRSFARRDREDPGYTQEGVSLYSPSPSSERGARQRRSGCALLLLHGVGRPLLQAPGCVPEGPFEAGAFVEGGGHLCTLRFGGTDRGGVYEADGFLDGGVELL